MYPAPVQALDIEETVFGPVWAGYGVYALCLKEGLEELQMPDQLPENTVVYFGTSSSRRALARGDRMTPSLT